MCVVGRVGGPQRVVVHAVQAREGHYQAHAEAALALASSVQKSSIMQPILVHTNRSLPPLPSSRLPGYALHTGWYADEGDTASRAAELSALRKRFGGRAKPKWMVEHSFKWAWASERARRLLARGHDAKRPVLVADSDVIIQCDRSELLERWRAFGAPIVASAERLWAPHPPRSTEAGLAVDPFAPAPTSGLRYPNSGLVMATFAGLDALWRSIRRIDTFPCCTAGTGNATYTDPSRATGTSATPWCVVNDQTCLQSVVARVEAPAARAELQDRRSPRQNGNLRIAIDRSASLFLSLFYLNPDDVVGGPDGRLVFARTNTTPCILHANGACKRCLLAKLGVTRLVTSKRAHALRWDECRLFRQMQPCALPPAPT